MQLIGPKETEKISRKIGRKLIPPKNTTNTEVKTKSIILPEQSIAADKEGLAFSKMRLTLKELLQLTSHQNPRVRNVWVGSAVSDKSSAFFSF